MATKNGSSFGKVTVASPRVLHQVAARRTTVSVCGGRAALCPGRERGRWGERSHCPPGCVSPLRARRRLPGRQKFFIPLGWLGFFHFSFLCVPPRPRSHLSLRGSRCAGPCAPRCRAGNTSQLATAEPHGGTGENGCFSLCFFGSPSIQNGSSRGSVGALAGGGREGVTHSLCAGASPRDNPGPRSLL